MANDAFTMDGHGVTITVGDTMSTPDVVRMNGMIVGYVMANMDGDDNEPDTWIAWDRDDHIAYGGTFPTRRAAARYVVRNY